MGLIICGRTRCSDYSSAVGSKWGKVEKQMGKMQTSVNTGFNPNMSPDRPVCQQYLCFLWLNCQKQAGTWARRSLGATDIHNTAESSSSIKSLKTSLLYSRHPGRCVPTFHPSRGCYSNPRYGSCGAGLLVNQFESHKRCCTSTVKVFHMSAVDYHGWYHRFGSDQSNPYIWF